MYVDMFRLGVTMLTKGAVLDAVSSVPISAGYSHRTSSESFGQVRNKENLAHVGEGEAAEPDAKAGWRPLDRPILRSWTPQKAFTAT
jgi:hypothetical protein